MKGLILAGLFLFSNVAHSVDFDSLFAGDKDCYSKMLSKGPIKNGSSQLYVLNENETIEIFGDRLNNGRAESAIKKLSQKLECQDNEIYIKSINCVRMSKKYGIFNCFADTNIGYFLVTKDYMNNINILFSRWD